MASVGSPWSAPRVPRYDADMVELPTDAKTAALAAALCDIGRRAHAREVVDGNAGNFSARLPDGNVLCTPTQMCKALLTPTDLCIVGLDGTQHAGRRRPSSEIRMHLALYAASDTVRAVMHGHPPYATTLAASGIALPAGVLPEGDIYLGPVPLVPYQTPGTAALGTALQPYAATSNAALLANHGAVTWGPDVEWAYCLLESLEAVCRVVYQARAIGGPTLISADERAKLTAYRRDFRAARDASALADAGQTPR